MHVEITEEEQQLAGKAVQKCRSGQSISDEEIDAGIKVLNQVIPALVAMGQCYYLVYSDLNRRRTMLDDFKRSRKNT